MINFFKKDKKKENKNIEKVNLSIKNPFSFIKNIFKQFIKLPWGQLPKRDLFYIIGFILFSILMLVIYMVFFN